MKKNNRYKILVALDGSKRSEQTVAYICEHLGGLDATFVLFHVLISVPECYWDLAKEPKSVRVVRSVRAWQTEQKRQIEEKLAQYADTLKQRGIAAERTNIKIRNRKKGVARDIIAEARNGYDAIIIRRRGYTVLPEIVMGSVALKLVQKLSFLPVLVAGRKPCTGKVLVAFDGSTDAMRAVRFAGEFTKGSTRKISLFYAMRGSSEAANDIFYTPPECIDQAREIMGHHFHAAVNRLESIGIPPDAINTRAQENVISRALAIRQEAESGDYGTIVVGRRGMSCVRDFFIGRVSNKILNSAREHAVWIIT